MFTFQFQIEYIREHCMATALMNRGTVYLIPTALKKRADLSEVSSSSKKELRHPHLLAVKVVGDEMDASVHRIGIAMCHTGIGRTW
jgi:hypothetical protein